MNSLFKNLATRSARRKLRSTTSEKFLGTVRTWFREQPELLVDICGAGSGGSTNYIFFKSYDDFFSHLSSLHPQTRVIVYGSPQLPFRGIVDEEFISRALTQFAGTNLLVAELELTVIGKAQWYSNEDVCTPDELKEALSSRMGRYVAVGLQPRSQDEGSLLDAYVPTIDGRVIPGAY